MATQFLDDVIQGHQVIQSLDVTDLPAGEHKFWFRIATNALSQWQHLPVLVFKGDMPGKKIMITAGVHGDEYNGVLAAQKTARELIGKELAGTVTVVPTINLTGMLNHSRDFYSADPDASPANLNRFFPGDANGNEANRYLFALWNNLLKPNAELAIDLHTQTSGAAYPLYVFADFRIEQSLEMARSINPDAILNDPGDAGVLETVWNNSGIPSITIEVGMGRYTEQALIDRTVAGIFNVLKRHEVISGEASPVIPCLEGNEVISIRAEFGGFVLPQVKMMDTVEQGQLLAIQYDSFGDEIQRYMAPTSGTVLSHNIESIRAPGSLVVRLIK
ncbi:succinylglutamate desuccinylase/aspartoacylase family protein [Vibrio parahaemolyticus]|uniref:succinylglutamate desuccinylase/aspartoacylase family protein n=1 Tax=Vibrio parahaemolyticus TaxID=670 RepID=UPI00047184C4|nr:succinylglutamate desuccinylase/aspartoacylase family protein [Vibrio parahaemolyticus]MCI4894109.1 succinylglutamate desuccinylase/aspartoacylase family protein [Vibrio parahaemolyticus]MCR9792399.1 succinylglutamate desuccinylase/aspartoacylase family protein [Vibrio parahaemolyticus]MCR9831004.1 succinylglutamate desuccinylase/aspartoacylase family protein [Vibrio parahaemolyticus]MDF4960685.1 succinylglutamate desuccinylase/aspartoacylase family protein [Vibrio parahaemolyticus]MDF51774